MEINFPRSKNYAFTLEDRRVKLILILNNNCNKISIMLVSYCKELGNASLLGGLLKKDSRDQVLNPGSVTNYLCDPGESTSLVLNEQSLNPLPVL